MIYFYAACMLALIGTFTARQVRRALSYEKDAPWQYFLLYLAKDAVDVALFAFTFVQILGYVKGGA